MYRQSPQRYRADIPLCPTRDPDTRKTILSYYEIVVFFALGATLGAALSALFAEKAILFCCLFLIIAFLSMFAKEI
ncbi:MAG: DUF1275 family protein [Bilophila wadsworthia]